MIRTITSLFLLLLLTGCSFTEFVLDPIGVVVNNNTTRYYLSITSGQSSDIFYEADILGKIDRVKMTLA
jgi:hypothetical protein